MTWKHINYCVFHPSSFSFADPGPENQQAGRYKWMVGMPANSSPMAAAPHGFLNGPALSAHQPVSRLLYIFHLTTIQYADRGWHKICQQEVPLFRPLLRSQTTQNIIHIVLPLGEGQALKGTPTKGAPKAMRLIFATPSVCHSALPDFILCGQPHPISAIC